MRLCGCFSVFFVYKIILLVNMNMFYLLIFIFDVLCNLRMEKFAYLCCMFPQKFTVNPDYEHLSDKMEFSMSIRHVP